MGLRLNFERPSHWSTDGLDQRRALAFWVDAVCDRFLELDIDTPVRSNFRACMDQLDFGATTLSFVGAASQHIRRTPARISRTRYPTFFLLQFRIGQGLLRQRGKEVQVHTGDCVLVDGTEPYDLMCPQASSAVILRMPEDWLRRWLPNPENCAAMLFSQGDWSSALCAAMASLRLETCAELALPRSTVAEQIASLLTLAVGRGTGAETPRSLLSELIVTLRDRLEETDLSPLVVAAQHDISKRTLHYAFAAAGTTFVEQLMKLRLERAREILSDARVAAPRIEDVATRCGFIDPSHFARRFRQRYGHAPLQYRRAVL
ncbi:MAG TPA: helix-turn-helix domain-containing protein [Steroidobacteraceae bacterium]